MWKLKPERWGSPLVQEKYQACGKKQHSSNSNINSINNSNDKEMWNKAYVIIPVITGATGIVA